MNITLNGEKQDVTVRTVRELVEELGMGKQAVAVEINRELVPRKMHETTELSEGDVIELVTLVGGG